MLPYNKACPIIYDNDAVIDVYSDEYIMALASAGDIHLAGMITSSSIMPFNKYVPEVDFENSLPPSAKRLNMVKNRAHGVQLARESGFRNLPDPVVGIRGHLTRPSTGKIIDTIPFGSEGSKLIIAEARKASPENPLLLIMGGPLSVAADAYLLDPTIANRVVISWLGGTSRGMNDYNGGSDPWAAYIVVQCMQLVQFCGNYTEPPGYEDGCPIVPKIRLLELPDTPLRRWMIDKDCPTNDMPDESCGDSMPAVSLVCPEIVLSSIRVSFRHWQENDGFEVPGGEIPFYQEDPNGQIILITKVDVDLATQVWWQGMKNSRVWGNK
jgi:hypothetical protein